MSWRVLQGDALSTLRSLDAESVQTCVTSPPYWGLRDYGIDGQLGLEKTPEEYAPRLVEIFSEVRRVLSADGTCWLNLGDSYFGDSPTRKASSEAFSKEWNPADSAGNGGGRRSAARSGDLKPKDLVGIPWMVAFALRADGWYLRSDIVWSKPNPMPESVRDRPTKSHEYIFLLSKSERYYYDSDAIAEPNKQIERPNFDGKRGTLPKGSYQGVDRCGNRKRDETPRNDGDRWNENNGRGFIPSSGTRNKRSVWTVATKPYKEAHFATFPPDLIAPCILAGAPISGTVLDPFCGSGTTGAVAVKHRRNFIGIELNPAYIDMAQRRIQEAERQEVLNFEAA